MGVHLSGLAISAPCNEFSKEHGHSWPPIIPLHAMECAEEPFMSSGWRFMEGLDKIRVGGFGDVESVFEV